LDKRNNKHSIYGQNPYSWSKPVFDWYANALPPPTPFRLRGRERGLPSFKGGFYTSGPWVG
jgi:hypothetical protein